MNGRLLKGFLSILIAITFVSQAAFSNVGTAAGQLLRKMYTNGDFVTKQTLRLSDDVAAEFLGNISIVKELLKSQKGADDVAKASSFATSIKSSIAKDDADDYATLLKLISSDATTPDDARQLHDLLVYFSFRYSTTSKPIIMYCILCSGGSEFAKGQFQFTFKNADSTPFKGIIADINSKSLKEVKSEIDELMGKLKFDNFNYAKNESLMPGQEHSFLLFLRTMRSRKSDLKPYKEYAVAVKDLATKVAQESGEFFGGTNPNRFHMLIQEAIDLSTNKNANATPEAVIGTWTEIIKDTTKAVNEDPSKAFYDTFEDVLKKPLRDSKGNMPQKYADEIDSILNKCKFVSK